MKDERKAIFWHGRVGRGSWQFAHPLISFGLFFFLLPSFLILHPFGILSANAQTLDESARAHLSDILNKPLSPRAAALGNAFVAMPDDPNALFSNPASISTITIQDSARMNDLSLSYTHYVLDINEGAVVYE